MGSVTVQNHLESAKGVVSFLEGVGDGAANLAKNLVFNVADLSARLHWVVLGDGKLEETLPNLHAVLTRPGECFDQFVSSTVTMFSSVPENFAAYRKYWQANPREAYQSFMYNTGYSTGSTVPQAALLAASMPSLSSAVVSANTALEGFAVNAPNLLKGAYQAFGRGVDAVGTKIFGELPPPGGLTPGGAIIAIPATAERAVAGTPSLGIAGGPWFEGPIAGATSFIIITNTGGGSGGSATGRALTPDEYVRGKLAEIDAMRGRGLFWYFVNAWRRRSAYRTIIDELERNVKTAPTRSIGKEWREAARRLWHRDSIRTETQLRARVDRLLHMKRQEVAGYKEVWEVKASVSGGEFPLAEPPQKVLVPRRLAKGPNLPRMGE